jgi:Spy/CpxP family protein refolding chaperone
MSGIFSYALSKRRGCAGCSTKKLEPVSRELFFKFFLKASAAAAIRLDFSERAHHDGARKPRRRQMKNHINLVTAAVCVGTFVLLATTSPAQKQGAMSKAQAIAQQLNLTPDQKAKILPILADEGPKVQAIKNNNSLSKIQKIQQIRAIHQQTDPQMKAILSPEQYQKLQGIRRQAIKDATQGRI